MVYKSKIGRLFTKKAKDIKVKGEKRVRKQDKHVGSNTMATESLEKLGSKCHVEKLSRLVVYKILSKIHCKIMFGSYGEVMSHKLLYKKIMNITL